MLAIVAVVVSILATFAGAAVMFTKIVRHLTRIEAKVDQTAKLAAHVPGVYYRLLTVEKALDISAPSIPNFIAANGSGDHHE
jgi:hypothetical protein